MRAGSVLFAFGRPIASFIVLSRGVGLIERVLEPGFHLNPAVHGDEGVSIGGVLAPMAGASTCPQSELHSKGARPAKRSRKFAKANGRSSRAQA
jgi:hypothetical protein